MKEVLEKDLNVVLDQYRIVVIDFFAPWCSPCKSLSKDLEEKLLPLLNSDTTIIKVDIDQNPEITARLSIMSVPTVMIFYQGKRVILSGDSEDNDRLVGFNNTTITMIRDIIEMINTQEKKQ